MHTLARWGMAVLLALGAPAAIADELRAGFAVVDLTPDHSVPLAGYAARSVLPSLGVHDPICARAMALDDGGNRLALVSLDMIGVDRRCRDAVLAELRGQVDLRPEQFLICATHTHNGPGALARGLHWWIATGVYNDRFFRSTVKKIAAAVVAAFGNLTPARLGTASAPLEGRNRNRRRGDGFVDRDLTLVRVDRADGTPLGVLVNFAAHPTMIGAEHMVLSADWPGALCRELERRRGPGFTAVLTNGDEGDLSPSAPSAENDWGKIEAFARVLADDIDGRLPAIATDSRVLLRGGAHRVRLPAPKIPLVFPRDVLLQYWQVQGALFLAIPGEACADLGRDLKQSLAGRGQTSTTIIGLANDHLGYFTSADGYAGEGYEKDMNFYGANIGATFQRGFGDLVAIEDPWGW